MLFIKLILTYSATFTLTSVVINIHGQPLTLHKKHEYDYDISEREEQGQEQFPVALDRRQKFLKQTRTNSQCGSVLNNTDIENDDVKKLQRCIRSYGKKKTRKKKKQKARIRMNKRNKKKQQQKKRVKMMKKKQRTPSALKKVKCEKRRVTNNERHFSLKTTRIPRRSGNKRERKISTRYCHVTKPMTVHNTAAMITTIHSTDHAKITATHSAVHATITTIHPTDHAMEFQTVVRNNEPDPTAATVSETHHHYTEDNSASEEVATTQANSMEYTNDNSYQSAEQTERQNALEQFTSETESATEATATTSAYFGRPILKFLCDPSMRPLMRAPVHLISLIGRFQRIKKNKKSDSDDNKDPDTTTERPAQSDEQFTNEPANNAAESEERKLTTELNVYETDAMTEDATTDMVTAITTDVVTIEKPPQDREEEENITKVSSRNGADTFSLENSLVSKFTSSRENDPNSIILKESESDEQYAEGNIKFKTITDSTSPNFDLYYKKYLDNPLCRHNYCLPP